MHWFIFTSNGRGFQVEGEGITQAVAAFRKLKKLSAGEVVGVIRGSGRIECGCQATATPVFGVICVVAEKADVIVNHSAAGD